MGRGGGGEGRGARHGLRPPPYRQALDPPLSTTSHTPLCHDQRLVRTLPRARLRFGERAFSIAAPLLWNSLSAETRNVATMETFKKKLKTFMFYKHLGD